MGGESCWYESCGGCCGLRSEKGGFWMLEERKKVDNSGFVFLVGKRQKHSKDQTEFT